MFAYALDILGTAGLSDRTHRPRDVATYACRRLHQLGWPHWRNPNALTVMLREPPDTIRTRWRLPSAAGWSHLICVPGITTRQIDEFVDELGTAVLSAQQSAVRPTLNP